MLVTASIAHLVIECFFGFRETSHSQGASHSHPTPLVLDSGAIHSRKERAARHCEKARHCEEVLELEEQRPEPSGSTLLSPEGFLEHRCLILPEI